MFPKDEIQAVFFDLDGTLLDTATDLAHATNRVLVHHGKKSKPLYFIRPLVGGGTASIITNTFDISLKDPKYNQIKQELLQAYQQLLTQNTHLFPGIREVLGLLNQQHVPWGIITNKPTWLAQPLVQHLQHELAHHGLVGRETLPYCKPHPLPLRYACRNIHQIAHQRCVYVGDAKTDIMAAKAAGMFGIAAAYGYIAQTDNPENWQADYIIQSAYDLIPWLEPRIKANKEIN